MIAYPTSRIQDPWRSDSLSDLQDPWRSDRLSDLQDSWILEVQDPGSPCIFHFHIRILSYMTAMDPQVAKGLETLESSVWMIFNDDAADLDPEAYSSCSILK